MDLFVYGTLRNEVLMKAVAGGVDLTAQDATLSGYSVFELADHVVPLIVPDELGQSVGCIYKSLDAAQLARLDLFEGAFDYKRQGVVVETADGSLPVDVYLPPSEGEHSGVLWSLEDWEKTHLNPTIFAVEELFSHDPYPAATALRRMWPVIEKRAWARHRAVSDGSMPATVRFDAQGNDSEILDLSPPRGTFFRLQDFGVTHTKFGGGQSEVLQREVFMGVDAALVLPYDPVTDNILLIEQFRMGPLRRGDPNPWQLEPIAGMTDARESPQEAARRESLEEANIKVDQLDLMFSMYPSPGCSTDYFVCYCAPCDLPNQKRYLGGLEAEAEDLRIHILSLSQALDLIDSGEVSAGPLVAMLYWIDRHKDRYRSAA